MKQSSFFLIFLLLVAQVDDAWAGAAAVPSTVLPADDDEYLPAPPRPQETHCAVHWQPVPDAESRQKVTPRPVGRDVSSVRNLHRPDKLRPQYVFMSLQI